MQWCLAYVFLYYSVKYYSMCYVYYQDTFTQSIFHCFPEIAGHSKVILLIIVYKSQTTDKADSCTQSLLD